MCVSRSDSRRRQGADAPAGLGEAVSSGLRRLRKSSSDAVGSVSKWWTSAHGPRTTRPTNSKGSSPSSSGRFNPGPARLAIGFTGPVRKPARREDMGGTRAPSVRTSSSASGAAKSPSSDELEMLVHELGHFLGAAHSPNNYSVMRPDIGHRHARSPISTSVSTPRTRWLCTGGRGASHPHPSPDSPLPTPACQQGPAERSVPPASRRTPDDPAAPRYLAMLDQSLGFAGNPPSGCEP